MATRSRIGIELKDGSILSVYHHWDGYPQWLGRILKTHYNSREQAAELIDGGDMSSAGQMRSGVINFLRVNMLLSITLHEVKLPPSL